VIPQVKVPVDADSVQNFGTRPDVPIIDDSSILGPLSGSTSGVGDLTYVGLITPRNARQTQNGKIVWAAGPTFVLPTAEEDILGQGRYQAGPAFAYGYLGSKWTIGVLAQHWWSIGDDDDRSSVNQTNFQYFVYRKLPNQWAIGASPNITLDWSDSGSPIINAPIGIGINKTLFIGKVPFRIGVEVSKYAVHESNIKPDWGFRFSITPVIPSAFFW